MVGRLLMAGFVNSAPYRGRPVQFAELTLTARLPNAGQQRFRHAVLDRSGTTTSACKASRSITASAIAVNSGVWEMKNSRS